MNNNCRSINFAYDLFESNEGSNPDLSPVIFIHGLASDRRTWKYMAPVIAEKTKRKVYAYDARNYGDSDYTDEFSFTLNVEDLFSFMNSVNAPKAILFGHSMGAVTAYNAALRKPERVAMVMSEDTFVKTVSDQMILISRDYLDELSEAFSNIPNTMNEEEANRKIVDDLFDNLCDENKKWTPKDILYNLHTPFKRDADGRYMANYNEKALHHALSDPKGVQCEPVGSYEGPAVIFCGARSVMDLRSHRCHIRGFFPNVEFVEFEEGYHNLHAQYKEKFADDIVEAMNRYNVS